MRPAEILRAAKAKIEDPAHWCQGMSAQDSLGNFVLPSSDRACKWCVRGSVNAVSAENLRQMYISFSYLDKAAAAMGFSGDGSRLPSVHVNDDIGHPTAMKMFDRAIELAEVAEQ